MNTDFALLTITAIGIIGTAVNVYLTARIKADVAELKIWCMREFVSKSDFWRFNSNGNG